MEEMLAITMYARFVLILEGDANDYRSAVVSEAITARLHNIRFHIKTGSLRQSHSGRIECRSPMNDAIRISLRPVFLSDGGITRQRDSAIRV